MAGHRTDQVGAQVQQEIMEIIRRDLKDPRIGFVSITGVRMSPDLRTARVRVSVLGDDEEQRRTLAGLRSATGLIRRELGRRLENLRFSPELRFEIDTSIEYSVRISKTLREILPERGQERGEEEEEEGG
jgi:ribosome-binding factor A